MAQFARDVLPPPQNLQIWYRRTLDRILTGFGSYPKRTQWWFMLMTVLNYFVGLKVNLNQLNCLERKFHCTQLPKYLTHHSFHFTGIFCSSIGWLKIHSNHSYSFHFPLIQKSCQEKIMVDSRWHFHWCWSNLDFVWSSISIFQFFWTSYWSGSELRSLSIWLGYLIDRRHSLMNW